MAHTKRRKGKTQPINVFVRVRPINKQETDAHCVSCIEVANGKEVIVKEQRGKKYVYDGVFDPSITQLTVYETVVKPLISEILAGYNCTVFAYGQTGTGKTYTMAGDSAFTAGVHWQDNENAGIIPRALAHLFDELTHTQQEYTVRVSYLELYNEELHDLLSNTVDGSKKIKLFDDQRQKGSVIVQGIEEQTVHNKFDVYQILKKGQEKRHTAVTLTNIESSRSHTVLTITVHTRETPCEGEEFVKTGKLNLVDLAGSENVSKSGAVDRRAREAGIINQSLLTLGRVIKSLVEKSAHVPYRESKLTRLLQDSIGGRTKTSIIATISPATTSLEETLSTLKYANRARNINNRPEVNQRISQKGQMSQYEKEIERLRKDLSAARTSSGIYISDENYCRMIKEQAERSKELAKKIDIIRDLSQQITSAEERKQLVEEQWNQLCRSFDETKEELSNYHRRLQQMTLDKEENEHLADVYGKSSVTLHKQADEFLEMTKSSMIKEDILRKKVEALYASTITNMQTMKKLAAIMRDCCLDMEGEMAQFMKGYYSRSSRMVELVQLMRNIQQTNYRVSMGLTDIREEIRTAIDEHREFTSGWLNDLINRCNEVINTINNNWSTTQLWESVEQTLCIEMEQHEELSEKLEVKLKEVSIAISGTSREVSMNLNAIKEGLLVELEKLSKKLNSKVDSSDDAMQYLDVWSEEMYKMIDSCADVLQQKLQPGRDADINSRQQVEFIKSSVKSHMLAFSNGFQIHIGNITAINEEFGTTVVDSIDKRPALAFRATLQSKFDTDKLVRNQNVTAQQQKLSEDIKASGNDLMRSLDLSTLAAKLEDTASSYRTSKDMIIEAQEVLGDSLDAGASHEKSLGGKLGDCCTTVTSFSDKNIIEIKHEGDTPVRSRYKIPSSLKEPSPKDRLLQIFRQQQMPESPTSTSDVDDPPDTLSLPTIEEFPGPNGGAPDDDRTTHVLPENLRSGTNKPDGDDGISIVDSSDTSYKLA